MASLFPNLFPKLNTLVDVAVRDLCERLGVHKVEVHPIGDQGRILATHYGYEKVVLARDLRDTDMFCSCESQTMSNIIYVKNL